jgi:hypothetical protein
VLQLTELGWQVLRGEQSPRLLKPPQRKEKQRQSRASAESWEGVDRDLFERLRVYRRRKAEERGVPPFIIFSDATLRDLARVRPTKLEELPSIHGIGAKKLAEYGAELVIELKEYMATERAIGNSRSRRARVGAFSASKGSTATRLTGRRGDRATIQCVLQMKFPSIDVALMDLDSSTPTSRSCLGPRGRDGHRR